MNRITKNIIMIIILGCMIGCCYFTMRYVNSHVVTTPDEAFKENIRKPDRELRYKDQNENNSILEHDNDKRTKPDKGNLNEEEISNEKNHDFDENRPELFENDNLEDTMPDVEHKEEPINGDEPLNDMSNVIVRNINSLETKYKVIYAITSLLFSLDLVYLLMSNFNKKSFKETLATSDKIIIFILFTIILTVGLTYGNILITEKFFSSSPNPIFLITSVE